MDKTRLLASSSATRKTSTMDPQAALKQKRTCTGGTTLTSGQKKETAQKKKPYDLQQKHLVKGQISSSNKFTPISSPAEVGKRP